MTINNESGLGPLPDASTLWGDDDEAIELGYTANQMRAYAAQEVATERERWTEAVMAELDGNGQAQAAEAYAKPREPLTRQQIDDVMTQHYPLSSLLREEVDAFEACVREIERLHGIGA